MNGRSAGDQLVEHPSKDQCNSTDVGSNPGHGKRWQRNNPSRTIWQTKYRIKRADWKCRKKPMNESSFSSNLFPNYRRYHETSFPVKLLRVFAMVQHIMLDQKVKSYSKMETLHKPSMYSWMNVAPRLTTASIRIPNLLLSVLAASYITFESTSEQEWSCSGTQVGAEHNTKKHYRPKLLQNFPHHQLLLINDASGSNSHER